MRLNENRRTLYENVDSAKIKVPFYTTDIDILCSIRFRAELCKVQGSRFQGFFICHIIVIQGIIRSEMKSNQVRSVDSAKNKNTNYIK